MFSKKILLIAVFALLISPQTFAGGPGGGGSRECLRSAAKAANTCFNNGPGNKCERAVERAINQCIPRK